MATESKKTEVGTASLYQKISKDDVMYLLFNEPYTCTYTKGSSKERMAYEGCQGNLLMILDDQGSCVRELGAGHPDYNKDKRTIIMTIKMYMEPCTFYLVFDMQ